LLKASTIEGEMSTVNFSIPEDLKREFNETFEGENKSAVLAGLMRQAIEQRRQEQRRAKAIDALLDLRRQQTPVGDEEIRKARRRGRP
jgi:metal-responsive CopG/Arc/MetJ family transcriptional regulator